MKAIMYHYINPGYEWAPWFRYLHLQDFKDQLDYFSENDRFIGREEFLSILDGQTVPEDGIVLTFDDGFRDHYNYVAPELLTRGLWGLFFITTGIFQSAKLLNVHRIHSLIGRYGGDKIHRALMERLEPNMLKHDGNYEFHALTYQKSDDDDSTTTVKRILNYLIDDSYKDQILDDMVDNYLNESELFDELYMTIPMLRKMAQKGMLIGGHSMTHRPLSLLSPDEQYQEIHGCLDFLKSNVGETEMESFCYPYGGFHTFTKDTEKILAERGCRCTFNVESRDILESDLRHRPHALPRFDCNEFPHGRASIGMPGRNSTKES